MSASTFFRASMALIPFLLHTFLPVVFSSSGYSAEIEDQTVITIHDAYPKDISPKAWAATPKEVKR